MFQETSPDYSQPLNSSDDRHAASVIRAGADFSNILNNASAVSYSEQHGQNRENYQPSDRPTKDGHLPHKYTNKRNSRHQYEDDRSNLNQSYQYEINDKYHHPLNNSPGGSRVLNNLSSSKHNKVNGPRLSSMKNRYI